MNASETIWPWLWLQLGALSARVLRLIRAIPTARVTLKNHKKASELETFSNCSWMLDGLRKSISIDVRANLDLNLRISYVCMVLPYQNVSSPLKVGR